MDITTEIVSLKRKVKAVQEELTTAIGFHEAWKPTAYDTNLHARMGKSFATNTFGIVRIALRREMLLALIRLWDKNSKAISMEAIALTLRKPLVLDALVAECEAQWINQPTYDCGDTDDLTPEIRVAVDKHIKTNAEQFAREQSALLRSAAEQAICIIGNYTSGGSKHATLQHLRTLRNERLAYRQILASIPITSVTDIEVEIFYQDMLIAAHKLLLAVENTHYDLNETAKIKRRHAELFWKSPRGEMSEGHPDYQQLPKYV